MIKTLLNFSLLLFILVPVQVNANNMDRILAERVAWTETATAARISDVTMFSLMAAPYLLVDSKKQMPTIFFTQAFNWLLTDVTKMRVKRVRPNGEDDRSFFSGHTSTAFTSAGLICSLNKEYCTEALVLAGLTGYLRMAATKHFFSDVVIGAGIGYAFGRYLPTILIGF